MNAFERDIIAMPDDQYVRATRRAAEVSKRLADASGTPLPADVQWLLDATDEELIASRKKPPMPHSTEIGIWRQITGLNVTDIRRVPPVEVNPDGSISHYSVYASTVDGKKLVPGDRVELQIDGQWPDTERATNGVYTFNGPGDMTVKLVPADDA